MDLVEYNQKFHGKVFPKEGLCHVVKLSGIITKDCINCQNYYIEDREQWLKEVKEALQDVNPPFIINWNCKDGFEWLLHKLKEIEVKP